jgi:hypothetical protein
MKTLLRCAFAVAIAAALYGCGVTQMAGGLPRSGQKDVDIVLAQGIAPQMLKEKKSLGVYVTGSNAGAMYASGQGATSASVYSDMITKEFMRMGYTARTISEPVTETMAAEKLSDLSAKGFQLLLVGNLNISTTTSSVSWMTGGDYANTGVTSATVKGIDVKDSSVLFVLSTEYGKAKEAGEVSKDLGQLYADVLSGKVTPKERED